MQDHPGKTILSNAFNWALSHGWWWRWWWRRPGCR